MQERTRGKDLLGGIWTEGSEVCIRTMESFKLTAIDSFDWSPTRVDAQT